MIRRSLMPTTCHTDSLAVSLFMHTELRKHTFCNLLFIRLRVEQTTLHSLIQWSTVNVERHHPNNDAQARWSMTNDEVNTIWVAVIIRTIMIAQWKQLYNATKIQHKSINKGFVLSLWSSYLLCPPPDTVGAYAGHSLSSIAVGGPPTPSLLTSS